MHDDVRALAAATGVDFAFDVILNREQRVIAAFGGDVLAMHAAARAAVRELSMRPSTRVRRRRDDQLRLPARPEPLPGGEGDVRGCDGRTNGGPIVCAAECRDGFPGHGSLPRGAGRGADPASPARRDRAARTGPCPTSGRCRSRPGSSDRARVGCTPIYPHRRGSARARTCRSPDIAGDGRGRARRAGPARDASACCPRGRRPPPIPGDRGRPSDRRVEDHRDPEQQAVDAERNIRLLRRK